MQLMGREALLRAAKQMRGLQHFVQRQVCILEHGFDLDRELLAAFPRAALPEAVPDRAFRVFLARLGADTFQPTGVIDRAAMRTNRTFRPPKALQMPEGGGFVS